MLPVLFRLGPVSVYSYSVTLIVAFAACWMVVRWYFARVGVARAAAADLVLAAAVGGIIGARALYVANNWSEFAGNPLWIAMLQRGGLVFLGGLAGGAIAVVLVARWQGLPLGQVANAAAIAVPLGNAIGRVGCLLNGCCGGAPTDAWYGIVMPGSPGRVMPSQILDSGLNLALFAGLWVVALRRQPRPWSMWWGFLTVYSVSRFLVEMTRVTPVVAFGLTQAQAVCVVLFAVGVAGLAGSLRRDRESPPPDPAPSGTGGRGR